MLTDLAERNDASGHRMFGVGALITAIVSGGGWISGMITMDQGQIMQSIIDDAANTSPLLDNPSKAQFIGVTSPGQSAARKDRYCGKSNQQKQNKPVCFADLRFNLAHGLQERLACEISC